MAKVGMRDVAALAGVSHGTVSHFLNHPDRVSREKAERISRAIETLGFVPNTAGRQLRLGTSSAIAYIAPDVSNPYFATLAEGVEARAAEHGLSVFISNSNHSRVREDAYLDLFERQQVRGMLVASQEATIEERLARIRQRGTVSVLMGRAPGSPEQPSVSVDDVAGGVIATRHLLETGRRRIAFVGGPLTITQVGDRLSGTGQVVREEGSATLEVIPTTDRRLADGFEIAREIIGRPADRRPDAVFAVNDLLALGILREFVAGGIRVPDDIAVIGYDDIEFAESSIIPLSSVRSPHETFGAAAVDLLLAEIQGEEHDIQRVYTPELVVRESTRGRI